jgi:hypothetical protein
MSLHLSVRGTPSGFQYAEHAWAGRFAGAEAAQDEKVRKKRRPRRRLGMQSVPPEVARRWVDHLNKGLWRSAEGFRGGVDIDSAVLLNVHLISLHQSAIWNDWARQHFRRDQPNRKPAAGTRAFGRLWHGYGNGIWHSDVPSAKEPFIRDQHDLSARSHLRWRSGRLEA